MDRRDRQNLAAALLVLALIAAGYWLMTSMRHHAAIEDCLMARRRNCDALQER